MKIIMLWLALFPFLHATSYNVSYVSCTPEEIVVRHKDENLKIALFNIAITKDEAKKITCDVLKHAKKIQMEIDPSSKIEEVLPVYVFVDGKLLQEELIEKSLAYPLIKNPEYTYEERLEKAVQSTQVMAEAGNEKAKKDTFPIIAPIFLALIVVIWILMVVRLIYNYKKKMKINKKKDGKQERL